MTFKIGDFIRVPKGTLVYDESEFDSERTPSKRDIVVQVSKVEPVSANDHIRMFLTESQIDLYWQEYRASHNTWGSTYRSGSAAEFSKKWQEELEKIAGKDAVMVYWSKDNKWALASDVTLTTPIKAPKKPTPKTEPTKREQMVPKSKWKFTKDIELVYDTKVYANIGGYRSIVYRHSAKAGEEFTIVGKFSQAYDSAGFQIPIEIAGKKIPVLYTAIEPVIEAVDIPTVEIIVLRDKNTGEYFEKTPYYRQEDNIVMTDKYSKAKKYNNLGVAKSSILGYTGYYDGMPETEGMPDWTGGRKDFDLPKSWEAVKFNKITKAEVEVIDIQEWFKRVWKLRAITIEYGGAVRKVFSEIEKKGKIDEYKGLLVFRTPVKTITHTYQSGNSYSYTEQDEISEERVADIDAAIAHASLKKGDYIRAKNNTSVAIAFANPTCATLAKLGYAGDLRATAVSLTTMQEIIEEK